MSNKPSRVTRNQLHMSVKVYIQECENKASTSKSKKKAKCNFFDCLIIVIILFVVGRIFYWFNFNNVKQSLF